MQMQFFCPQLNGKKLDVTTKTALFHAAMYLNSTSFAKEFIQ